MKYICVLEGCLDIVSLYCVKEERGVPLSFCDHHGILNIQEAVNFRIIGITAASVLSSLVLVE